MSSSRGACCCLSLRQFFITQACLSLLTGVGLVGVLWYQVQDPEIIPQLFGVRSNGVVISVLAINAITVITVSILALRGVLYSKLAPLKWFKNYRWCDLVLSSIYLIVSWTQTHRIWASRCKEEFTAKFLADGINLKEHDVAGLCQFTSIFTDIILVIFTLVQIYWCILLSRYVRQVSAQDDWRGSDVIYDIEANKGQALELKLDSSRDTKIERPIEEACASQRR